MARSKRKIQPVRTELRSPKSSAVFNRPYSSFVLASLLLALCCQICPTQAACPTIFFAQAIGHTKMTTIDFYYTKTGVPTTAECANFCGLRQFCRTAVYNHDARTCALSYEVIFECSTIKQRYNTFHLTTDGADSLSVVTCIDPCRKSFVGSSAMVSNENPKTLFSRPGKTDTIEKVPSIITSNEAIPSENNPIVPVKHPFYTSNGSSSFETKGSGASPNMESIEKQWKLATGQIQLDDPRLNGFLKAIQQLHKVNEKLLEKEKEQEKGLQRESNTTKNTVTFQGMPLHIQEYFNGATNAQQAQENHLKSDKHEAESDLIRTFFNGTERKVHTGGLFKWLKPGESIVIAPPQLSNSGVDTETFKSKIPVELVTAGPEGFDRGTKPPVSEVKKTVTAASKIKVEERSRENTSVNSTTSQKTQGEADSVILREKIKELKVAFEAGEPIVINGHILSAKEARELMDREKTSSTTTTTVSPWHPAGLIGEEPTSSVQHENVGGLEGEKKKTAHTALQDDQGFLNTFVMQGLSDIMKGKDLSTSTITTASKPSTGTTTTTPSPAKSKRPIVCYRYVPQQRLLYAEFRKGRGITLNECRCACAETWRNVTFSSDKSDQKANLCKSISFTEETGECSLNGHDHTGKYDLIFDKKTDYHYVSCDIHYLLTTAAKMCAKPLAQKTKGAAKEPTDTTFKAPTTTARPLRTSTEKTSTKLSSSKAPSNEQKSAKAHGTTLQKEGMLESDAIVNKTAGNEEEQEPLNKQETNILTAETTTEATRLFNRKVISTNLTESSSVLVSSRPIKMAAMTTILLREMITPTPMTTTTTTSKPKTTTSEAKPHITQSSAVINAKLNGCFEIIEGYIMNNTAGGLERDVSMEECRCFCANSLSSERYSFQCTSATYYHKERDCVLNLGNRQLTPEVFVENDQQHKPESRLSYLGLICNPAKAIEKHVSKEMSNGCTPSSIKQDIAPAVTIPAVPKTTTPTAHTDQCFLELPNHVLEGTALAIETNVTVEECKCFCVDSEHRYGTECQSLQYYFDSQTCLLNKENRITDPDRFNYDPGSNVMHSYFDYKCHVEKVVLSAYIEQVCQMVTQISIKDVLNPPKTNPSLNIDDKSTEATRGLKTMEDTSKLKKIDNIDAKTSHTTSTKFTKPTFKAHTTSKPSTLSRKLRTTTSVPTTTRPTTSTITTAFQKLDSDSEENEEDFTELKFESTTLQTTTSSKANSSDAQNQGVVLKTAKSITIFKKNKKQKEKTIIPELEENEEEEDMDSGSGQPAEKEDHRSRSKSEEQEEIDNETHNDSAKTLSTTIGPETTTTTTATTPLNVWRTTPFMPTTSTTTGYPPVGPCRYSALYQTVFNGGRQLKALMVNSPAQCFAACIAERCRSANLIQIEGTMKKCELFKDSIVEFRRTDVLSFDRGAVHFDSIQCDEA